MSPKKQMKTPLIELKKPDNFRISLAVALILTSCIFPVSLQAADKIWVGTNSDWTRAANWTGGVPASTDNAIFGDSAAVTTGPALVTNRTVVDFNWNRTIGSLEMTPGNSGITSPIGLFVTGNFTSLVGASELTIRSNGRPTDPVGSTLRVAISGNLTLSSTLSLGNWAISNSSNSGLNSSIYGISVGGTTTLNSASALKIARLATVDGVNGTADLGSLEMNGGSLYLFSGSIAGTGAIVGSETTVTVNRLNGASGLIAGNKAAGGLTYGQLVVSGTANGTYGGSIIDGAVSASSQVRLTKAGSGTLTLAGNNTYTGTTTVTAGTLVISSAGSISNTSAVTVAAGARFAYNSSTARTGSISLGGNGNGSRATLSGTGAINTSITLDNLGDTLSPGNSPGIQNFGSAQAWNSLTYVWEVNDFVATTAGAAFDQISIVGGLNLSGGTAYQLDITSLTALNELGNVANFSETDRTWTILTTTTGISGFDDSKWTILTSNFSPSFNGTFSLTVEGNNLQLHYLAVPEPSSVLMLGFATGFVLFFRRRRA